LPILGLSPQDIRLVNPERFDRGARLVRAHSDKKNTMPKWRSIQNKPLS